MVEQDSKPDGGLSSVPPQQSAESGVFLRAIIPDVKSDASLPFGPGHSNQSGIFPGITGSTPEAIPPAVEPPESPGGSNGSTIYRLEPPPPDSPQPTYPAPEAAPPQPRIVSDSRGTHSTPVPRSRISKSGPSAGDSRPSPVRIPDADHDYSKPLLIAYSIATTIVIVILLIRNAIIGLITGS